MHKKNSMEQLNCWSSQLALFTCHLTQGLQHSNTMIKQS